MTLKRILESRYQVFEAASRHEANQRVGECVPDLVILDFHLPRTNVRRLCTGLKEANGDRALPILVLADSADSVSLADALTFGADDRLYKPIPVNILESRVESLLKRQRMRHASPPTSMAP
jgi:PleD family two-component response regulator